LFPDVIALDQARHMNRVITIDSDFREFSLCGANPLEGGFGVGVE
jgi:predicted nuclease of predicted toxin-antitoxin system